MCSKYNNVITKFLWSCRAINITLFLWIIERANWYNAIFVHLSNIKPVVSVYGSIKTGEMYCLLRHVLHRSVAFISIISQGHFPLFSPRSSIFHLRAASSMHWGLGFDFKIHWKQLAPSLPSPVLCCSPPSLHLTHTQCCLSDPSGAFEPGALSPYRDPVHSLCPS